MCVFSLRECTGPSEGHKILRRVRLPARIQPWTYFDAPASTPQPITHCQKRAVHVLITALEGIRRALGSTPMLLVLSSSVVVVLRCRPVHGLRRRWTHRERREYLVLLRKLGQLLLQVLLLQLLLMLSQGELLGYGQDDRRGKGCCGR